MIQNVSGITILIVDDEPDLREILKIEFEMLGFIVLAAGAANEALEIMKSKPVDVLISDVLMPGGGGTGVQLLDRVAQLGLPNPITFLVTGFTDLLDDEALKKGVVGIFNKPFSRAELVEAVLAALNNRAPSGTQAA